MCEVYRSIVPKCSVYVCKCVSGLPRGGPCVGTDRMVCVPASTVGPVLAGYYASSLCVN